MPLHVLCLCTRILHLLWSPPQVRFKALLGASTCSSTSSTRFRSWDILSPFIVKAIESHINLGQQHLTVKVKSVIKDKKSQGKYWRSLLSFAWVLGSESHNIQSYLTEFPIVWQDPLKSPDTLKPLRSTSAFLQIQLLWAEKCMCPKLAFLRSQRGT